MSFRIIGEFMHRSYDYFLPARNCGAKVCGMFSPCDGIAYLRKLFDCILNLLVKVHTVSYDNNRIYDILKPDKLVSQPRY